MYPEKKKRPAPRCCAGHPAEYVHSVQATTRDGVRVTSEVYRCPGCGAKVAEPRSWVQAGARAG